MPTAIASGRRGEEEKKRREAETTQNQNNNPRLSGGENAKRALQLASASCTADSAGWRSLTPCFFQASHLKGSKVHFSPTTLHVNQIQRQSFLCCFHPFPLFRQFSLRRDCQSLCLSPSVKHKPRFLYSSFINFHHLLSWHFT